MAQTLNPSGIVIPQSTDTISASGVDEMRAVGSTTNTAIAGVSADIAALESGKADKGNLNGPMPILENADLNTVTATGMWRARPDRGITNYPVQAGDRWARFRSYNFVSSGLVQEWDALRGDVWRRDWDGTAWSEWRVVSGGSGRGGQVRTALETSGQWTTHTEEAAYLSSLSEHQAVTLFEVGRTVQDNPIWGVQVGSKTTASGTVKPAILVECNQHGNEPGSREGAMIFARELAQAVTFALQDIYVVIVPTVNPDRLHVSRGNANGVNLNRDWTDLTQPETQAVNALFAQHNFVAAIDGHSGGYARQVSIRETRNPVASTSVRERSLRLYNGVFSMFEDEGHEVRMYGEPDATLTPGTFNNEVPVTRGVPTLLLEIPSHWNYTPPAQHDPPPHWQAHMAVLCFREVLQIVWRERDAFKAAKEDS